MFVLTQLPTFPTTNASPGKAIRGCAPKVLAEPGPQLVWFWSGPGLVLVAAWLPRSDWSAEAQYYPVTSGRHLWADWFWHWLIIFFPI